jgi:hypothetical protein
MLTGLKMWHWEERMVKAIASALPVWQYYFKGQRQFVNLRKNYSLFLGSGLWQAQTPCNMEQTLICVWNTSYRCLWFFNTTGLSVLQVRTRQNWDLGPSERFPYPRSMPDFRIADSIDLSVPSPEARANISRNFNLILLTSSLGDVLMVVVV